MVLGCGCGQVDVLDAYGDMEEDEIPDSYVKLHMDVAGRTDDKQITLFDSVGFAIEDFSALRYVRDQIKATDLFDPLDLLADPEDPRDLFGMLQRAK